MIQFSCSHVSHWASPSYCGVSSNTEKQAKIQALKIKLRNEDEHE